MPKCIDVGYMVATFNRKGCEMARPKRSDAPDLGRPQELTTGLIERLTCPPTKQQGFLRDTKAPSLRVRVTANGSKSFVFEAKLNGKTIRSTIGDVRAWSIPDARSRANALRVTVDTGIDPREAERQQQAARDAQNVFNAQQATTTAEAWACYLKERRPHWSERHYKDHLEKSAAGGTDGRRGKTLPGPLHSLMQLPLRDLTSQVIDAWAKEQAITRPTSARLAWRLLKAFLGWCNEQPAYCGLLTGNPAKSKRSREALGKPTAKSDVLEKGQLRAWFDAVGKIHNPTVSACLQIMLLTGARPGEVLSLRWDDINTKWKGLQIRDKVEGTREIPLTPYIADRISGLKRRNEFVFAGMRADTIANPTELHARACKAAGLEGLTLHGLRRSFKSLTEWLEVPVGVVAQIQGHKPSATAEKHYTRRSLDLLRVHHERIEAWILEQAGIVFDAKAEYEKPRLIAIN